MKMAFDLLKIVIIVVGSFCFTITCSLAVKFNHETGDDLEHKQFVSSNSERNFSDPDNPFIDRYKREAGESKRGQDVSIPVLNYNNLTSAKLVLLFI